MLTPLSDCALQHGFARNLEWEIESTRPGGSPSITLKLHETPETLAMWDHKFDALFSITLSSGVLSTSLKVKNTGASEFEFQHALHSYFRVGDIDSVAIKSGSLLFADYLDKTENPPALKKWSAGDITIDKPVDSVYYGVSGEVTLEDSAARKKVRRTEAALMLRVDCRAWRRALTMSCKPVGTRDCAPIVRVTLGYHPVLALLQPYETLYSSRCEYSRVISVTL